MEMHFLDGNNHVEFIYQSMLMGASPTFSWPGRILRSRWTWVATSLETVRWSMPRGSAIMWDVTPHMWEPSALVKVSWLLVDAFHFFWVNLPPMGSLIRAGSTTSPLIIAFLILSNIFGPSGSRGLDFVVSACFHPRFHPQELHLSPGPLQGGTPLGALPAEAAGRAACGDARRELHRALPGAAGRGAATAEGIHR